MASMGNLSLVFSDSQSYDYYEQFGMPYHLVVKNTEIPIQVAQSKLFRGIILPNEVVEGLHHTKILKLIGSIKNLDPTRIVQVEVRYDSTSLVDTPSIIPAELYFYTIGPNLELSYRQVDSNRIITHLKSLKRL